MAKGFDVTGLSDFTEKATEIFLKSTLYRDNMSRFSVQRGVSHKEYLNYLDADPDLQAGACNLTSKGTTTFSEKEIEVVAMGVFDSFCLNDLAKKDIQAEVGTSKGDWNTLVKASMTQSIADNVGKKMDKLMWLGKVSGGDLFDGWVTKALASSTTNKIAETGAHTLTNIMDRVDNICTAVSEDVSAKGVLPIHVSYVTFNLYKVALRNANMYHNNQDNKKNEMDIFGWEGQFVLVAESGMIGDNKSLLCTYDKNLFVGVDEEKEVTTFQWYHNPSTKEVELSSNWKLGVEINLDAEIFVTTVA